MIALFISVSVFVSLSPTVFLQCHVCLVKQPLCKESEISLTDMFYASLILADYYRDHADYLSFLKTIKFSQMYFLKFISLLKIKVQIL